MKSRKAVATALAGLHSGRHLIHSKPAIFCDVLEQYSSHKTVMFHQEGTVRTEVIVNNLSGGSRRVNVLVSYKNCVKHVECVIWQK